MKLRKLIATFSIAALFAALALPLRAPAENGRVIRLAAGHSVVVPVENLRRVAVGDTNVAGVVAIGTSQLVINAKDAGRTSVFVWSGTQRYNYEVVVSNQTVEDIGSTIRAALAFPNVQVLTLGHAVVLRGSVDDMAQFVMLQELLGRFSEYAKDNKYTILNGVTISHSLQSIQHDFAGQSGVSELQIEPDGKGNVIVSGRVRDERQAQAVIQRARTLAGPYLAAEGKVINRLELGQTTQINVKVYVLEIDKTGLSQLGVRLQSGNPDPNNPNVIYEGPPSFPIIESAPRPGYPFQLGPFFRTVRLMPTIDALIQNGDARVLSAPNLVTMPGEEAKFLVGGSIPYAYSTGLGQVSIAFKDYGVQLDMTPNVLPNGAIQTKIKPDISDLDYQNAVTLNGFYIPALKESRLETDLTAMPGQSIIMGGLLRRVEQRTILKIPLLGDLPILGKLFQSTRYQSGQSDVVFVMTPEILSQ